MGKIDLNVTGGVGPYTVIIREVTEISGNRYTGPNPTNVLTNLDVDFIKDNKVHLYGAKVSNSSCADNTELFEQLCACEVIPSFVASQVCTNPSDPKISVTTSVIGNELVRIQIFNSNNIVVHDVTTAPGTFDFSVNNNGSYRIAVSMGSTELQNCKATDQIINVSCTVPCTLNVTVSNPSC
jgi:hypothetical protein